MIINVNVPDIGSDAVEVTNIFVRVGDTIKTEQSLITVEGDKASIEIPAPFSGVVKEININVGDKVNTGSPIMIFEIEDATPVITTTQENTSVIVTTPISHTNEITATTTLLSSQNNSKCADNNTYVHATPVIRNLAREFGLNLAKIKGTGRKGRILREDVWSYIKDIIAHNETTPIDVSSAVISKIPPWPQIDFSRFGDTEEVDLSRIQKISGTNLHRNWVMIPHVTQFDEADVTELEAFRKQQNNEAEKKKLNVKITLLIFIMKAVAKVLEELQRFNSSLSVDTQKLIIKKYINIGIAVDTQNGLVVPVFRDVNKKGILELSYELATISNKARVGKLTASDMQGSCFTISSLGSIGGTSFTPIINAPEVAILGISRTSIKPIWNGKEFIPRLILPLSLSYDHRVIDGADGARFINCINSIVSDIRCLVM